MPTAIFVLFLVAFVALIYFVHRRIQRKTALKPGQLPVFISVPLTGTPSAGGFVVQPSSPPAPVPAPASAPAPSFLCADPDQDYVETTDKIDRPERLRKSQLADLEAEATPELATPDAAAWSVVADAVQALQPSAGQVLVLDAVPITAASDALVAEPTDAAVTVPMVAAAPVKRKPGRPRKLAPAPEGAAPSPAPARKPRAKKKV